MKSKKKASRNLVTWPIDKLPINFPDGVRKLYEKNYIKNRKKYTFWIDKVGENCCEDIDWWMTLPSYRNPYYSNILNYMTVIDTLNQLKKKRIKIITHSKSMSEIINQKFRTNKINVYVKKKLTFFIVVKSLFSSIIFQTILYCFINIFVKKKKINKKNKIIIIDKFVTLRKKQNLNFYKPFEDTKEIKNFIVPSFVFRSLNFVDLKNVMIELLKKENNYIFKEHYLKIQDLLFAFFHILRRKKFVNRKYDYKKNDISKLIKEEILNFNDFKSIHTGILNYLFFKRAADKKLNLIKSINWFENQIVDKGWNLGFRKFFSKIEKNSYGYQDFNKHYNLISNSPSRLEYNSKVTPEKIVIISKLFKKITKEFFFSQKLILGKSWRFKKIINNKLSSIQMSKRNKITLILCGLKHIDEELIKLTINSCLLDNKIKIYVKPHPILDISYIISKTKMPKNFILYNGNLQKLLQESLISITAGPSSALLESFYLKTFIILPNIESGTEENAKIFNLNRSQFAIINNSKELTKTIKSLI